MRSSTFSSECAPLERGWGRTWTLSVVLVVLSVGALELELRTFGARPSVEDTAALWASERDQVDREAGLLVIVGSSRARVDIDLGTLAGGDDGGRRCVQLAIDGTPSTAILEDLSTSSLSRSLVICELHPGLTFGSSATGELRSRERLAYRGRREAWRNMEVAIETAMRMRLVSLRPELTPFDLWVLIRPSAWGNFRRVATLPTRQRKADYSTVDCRGEDRHWATVATDLRDAPVDLDRLARGLNACAQRLSERGNRLVFVRLPSSGLTKEAEDLYWPRARTWDRLVAEVEAPFIHFEDEPELRGFRCAEGSHMDETTAREFTERFAGVLRRRGLLEERAD